ncbi:UBX domain-containing protein 4 isoform X2 [Plutella xylostella]|uniref:UBX domain-containing protein 4 isoform X2 n=1 Tax=Plutella xylostella TaxID=51655 RepID=UPI00203304B5|nr:UBX domain-containing protein 4 isoform X2 [Plutella xylostella]
MLWFEGSVAEAVNLSKQRNAIFVVFVEGDNDLSSEMARTLEDGDITQRLVEQTNFLTIKLKSGSTDYVHFAQIYQFVPVPSLFFIGRNGTPLEVVCAGIQATSLATRIDRILEEHHKQSPSVSSAAVASGSKDNVKQTTADLIKSEASTSEASASVPAPSTAAAAPTPSPSGDPKPQYEVVCDGDVCVRRPLDRDEAGPSQPANPPPNLTPVLQPSAESIALVNQQEQAKMERAKLLIEARKREKAELEKQQEIQKELERRQVGQGVAELKKWQQDQEMKQIQEERRREKKENDMARQRVLDQIAQDRAERRARDLPPAPAPAPVTPVTPTAPLDLGNKARIQFKMPDGSSAAAQFDASDTLATVRRHVADNLHLTSSSFTLWTAFPRLELRDDSATLTQLKLAPSAALLVLPSSAVAKPNTSSRIASFTSFLIQILTSLVIEPTTLVYNWVRARLFPPPPANPRRPTPPPATSAPGLRYRHRTNVHRLNGDADDDENNTWNGNSTQQM